jgi:GT2 family glycosyltransferase
MPNKVSVVALVTSHNNPKLLEALKCLEAACDLASVELEIFLANSGEKKVSGQFPEEMAVTEIMTSRDTFWAGGMRVAWEAAEEYRSKFTHVLWLNDDTLVSNQAIIVLLQTLDALGGRALAIGSCSGADGSTSYGGQVSRHPLLPLHLNLVEPKADIQFCDSANGNLVLVELGHFVGLGGFPIGYTHLRADLAFAFEARKRRIPVVLAPGTLAHCEPNLKYKSYSDLRGMPLKQRFAALNDPKFGPIVESIRFSLKYGGPLAAAYVIAPWLKTCFGLRSSK